MAAPRDAHRMKCAHKHTKHPAQLSRVRHRNEMKRKWQIHQTQICNAYIIFLRIHSYSINQTVFAAWWCCCRSLSLFFVRNFLQSIFGEMLLSIYIIFVMPNTSHTLLFSTAPNAMQLAARSSHCLLLLYRMHTFKLRVSVSVCQFLYSPRTIEAIR